MLIPYAPLGRFGGFTNCTFVCYIFLRSQLSHLGPKHGQCLVRFHGSIAMPALPSANLLGKGLAEAAKDSA